MQAGVFLELTIMLFLWGGGGKGGGGGFSSFYCKDKEEKYCYHMFRIVFALLCEYMILSFVLFALLFLTIGL